MTPFSDLKFLREIPDRQEEFGEEVLRRYIDAFLIDEDEYVQRTGRARRNDTLISYIINEPFVIERSPPVHLNLKGVLTNTNLPVFIGAYMGWNVAPDHSALLFITVPGGIIIVSSATGLANALASGLSTSVKRLFHKK